jgi:SNF2 family DNA or RNA helicase
VSSTSVADVVGGSIVLRTPFAAADACRAISGGTWDRERRAWTWPATRLYAAKISTRFPGLVMSDQFRALLEAPGNGELVGNPQDLSMEFLIPPNVRTRPWKHQGEAVRFAMRRIWKAGAVMLAMGMGTGKTLVALILLALTAARRVLIVCPLRVVPVWQKQIAMHLADEMVVVALDDSVGSVAKKQVRAAEAMQIAAVRNLPFVAVINYDSLWREPFASWALKQVWHLVVMDESHRIKAPGGKASKFLARLRPHTLRRILMTGTPMPHSPGDIYAQFRAGDSTVFGNSNAAFRQRYCVMGGFQNKQVVKWVNQDEMNVLIRTITFRVGKEVLDLPPEMHVTEECSLSPAGARIYRAMEEDFVARVADGTVTAANALVKLLRLQQITGGWLKTDQGSLERVDAAKEKLLADVLEDIGADEPVVVFCRFRADLDTVHAACAGLGYRSMELSGRIDQLPIWQEGEGQVLATQISAGGVGVDLTRARYSIYYSQSFSLGEYDQSLSRVHRPGQTRPVEHIHLVARGTIDSKIMRALEERAEVIDAILAEIKGNL